MAQRVLVEALRRQEDTLFDDRGYHELHWSRPQLHEGGRLSHLVFVDGKLVDAWSEDVRDSAYAEIARRHDDGRRVPVVTPPLLPRHQQVLGWLDGLVGGRAALLELDDAPAPLPEVRDLPDLVPNEEWLVVDELLTDLTEVLLPAGLAPPLRACLLALARADESLLVRRPPAQIAAGITWVVGKANGVLNPTGAVLHKDVARHLGLRGALTSHGQVVHGAVGRLTWATPRPWNSPSLAPPDLLATGRPELLCQQLRSDLIRMRDDALAEEATSLPPTQAIDETLAAEPAKRDGVAERLPESGARARSKVDSVGHIWPSGDDLYDDSGLPRQ